jgi:hypothetical protein
LSKITAKRRVFYIVFLFIFTIFYSFSSNNLSLTNSNNEHVVEKLLTNVPSKVVINSSPPDAPILLSPTNGTVINSSSVLLNWTDVTDAVSYVVLMSDTEDFSGTVYPPKRVYISHFMYVGLMDDTFYWKVVAEDALHYISPFSNTWNFIIDTTPPPSPSLISPANNSLLDDPTPSFFWAKDSSHKNYLFQISTSETFSSIVISDVTTTNYTSSALVDGDYFWRVCASDYGGNVSPWSEIRGFTIEATAPNISNVVIYPSVITSENETTITAIVTDTSGVDTVLLHYRVNNSPWTNVTMSNVAGDNYSRNLGKFDGDDFVEFFISANDTIDVNNLAINDNEGLYYNFYVHFYDILKPIIDTPTYSIIKQVSGTSIEINCSVTCLIIEYVGVSIIGLSMS